MPGPPGPGSSSSTWDCGRPRRRGGSARRPRVAHQSARPPDVPPRTRHREAPREARGSPAAGLAPSGCHCAGPETHCLGQRALRVGDPTRTQCPLHGPRLLAEPRCAPASGRTRRMSRIDLPIGFWQGVETIPGIESQIPLEWLLKQVELALTEEEKSEIQALGGWEKLMETLKARLEEQKGRHQGGSKWIGTGGTSPFGASGYNPEGTRIG